MLSRPPSRSSLHLRRLRSREDVGLRGIAAFGTVLAAVFFSTVARAEGVHEVRVEERPSLEVVVTVKGGRAPTFQVFRLPGQDAFAVELPGAQLARAATDLGRSGVLLERASVEAEARNAPRVVVRFFGEVDYDAKTQGGTLVVTFTPLGDKAALRQAWSQRKSESDARASARHELEETKRKLEEQRRAYLAMVKDFEERQAKEKAALAAVEERSAQARAGLANLEQRKSDEEKRLEALVKQRDVAAAEVQRAQEGARRAEEERKRAVAAVKQTKAELKRAREELAKAKDQRAIEAAKSELAKLEQALARATERRSAEEQRTAALQQELAQARKELTALKGEQQKEQQALAAIQQRTRDEQSRAAAAQEETRRVEHLLASLKEQQGFEQRRLEDVRVELRRAAEEASALSQRSTRERTELAALERSVAEQRQALARLGQERQQLEQRLASLTQQAKEAETRLAAAERSRVAVARAEAAPQQRPAPRAAPAPAPQRRAEPRYGRIEMASAEPAGTYGFGGKSIDLTSSRPNRYEQSDGFDDYSDSEGLLSHVTVQRGQGAASRVGVRVDGGARYAVERVSQREIVLTLFGTRAANLDVRRILDARDLGTSVLRVLPRVHESGEHRIELTIELRDPMPVRVAHDDAMLWLHVGS